MPAVLMSVPHFQRAVAVAVKEKAVELDVVRAAGFVGRQSATLTSKGPLVWLIVPSLLRVPKATAAGDG